MVHHFPSKIESKRKAILTDSFHKYHWSPKMESNQFYYSENGSKKTKNDKSILL